MGWSGLGNALGTLIRFVTKLALVRILNPADFGLLAIATLVTSVAGLLQGAGLQNSLINQAPKDRKSASRWFDTGLWFQMAITGVIALLVFVFAKPLANYYAYRDLVPILKATAVCILLAGLSLVPAAVLTRELRFKELVIGEQLSLIVYGVVGIVLGIRGYHLMSLMYAQAISQLVFALSYFYPCARLKLWVPSLSFDRKIVRGLLVLGGLVMVNQFLAVALTQGDNAFIGKIAGAEKLGIYSMAYFLGTFVCTTVGGIVTRVAYPVYCRNRENPEVLARIYHQMFSISLLAVVPATLAMMVYPEKIIATVLSEKWAACAPLVPTMAVCGFFRYWNMVACIGIESEGRRGALIAAIAKAVQGVVMFPLLYFFYLKTGMQGVAVAVTVAMAVGAAITVTVVHRQFKLQTLKIASAFALPALIGALALGGLSLVTSKHMVLLTCAFVGGIGLLLSPDLRRVYGQSDAREAAS
jgi:O-antigen/teichoic acid export membrane protein